MNLIKRLGLILFLLALIAFPINYRTPASAQDESPYWPTQDWRTSSPEAQGLDSGRLAQMLTTIEEQGVNIHSVLVIRNGYIVVEAYGYPYQPDTLHSLLTCTRSVMSALIGSAMQQGHITSVDQHVIDFFPGRTFANLDDTKRAMTLEDLLTMRSGLPLDVLSEDVWQSDDLAQTILDQPMSTEPGTAFVYDGMVSTLLSLIVAETSGQDTLDFATQQLFEPLGIRDFRWEEPAPGIVDGNTGLWLTPRDMAKIGYLYAHDGVWDGVQILPPGWVAVSISPHVSAPSMVGHPIGDAYGYQWRVYNQGYFTTAGFGEGAQAIFVQPDLDLIAVFTGSANDGSFEGSYARGLFDTFILSAVQSADPLPENPEAQADLKNAVQALAQPNPGSVPMLPSTAQDISNRVYSLESNSPGWSTLELRFDQDQAEAALVLDGEVFQVGLDGVFRVNSSPDISWLFKGEWIGDNAFRIDWERLGDPFASEWLLRFEDTSVSVRIKNIGFWASEIWRFNGSAQP